ncbi:MAG: hypothetical protein EOQ98_19350 [Mesorhizobium sp.]|uniref:hypothetical protein n=1 Tax=Mesorhizobium sp. TaxID=1871066 RepID=UPI000FD5923C|nr:hypothetical protein [Mesorhizobium sp.]RUU46476.1 hypothetical protein EOD08_08235 [Mesorhizobium sp. M6A.T.Ca.TU.002.02.2.1]RWE55187.1 MAG: hypothetical protein EOS24_23825 [Mesorhizobium sp.]RWO97190.1 MAG: hypothetical protein EOQ98_19350 [Mesorhizobium sp.]TIM52593.1 MAG: hypothetical protein E5Y69_00800 [Mesorhizobium sp.]TIT07692.1 MAG: hypothetical protein E5W85_24590 [Mesorhizobium sp.]
MSDELRSAELLGLLGKDDFLRLVEAFGGTRLYVPRSGDTTAIAKQLGIAAANRLGNRYSGTYLRVPLARDHRARHYRGLGHSNADIARRLGMTETGVDKLFSRMPGKPAKGSCDPRQIDLFSSN